MVDTSGEVPDLSPERMSLKIVGLLAGISPVAYCEVFIFKQVLCLDKGFSKLREADVSSILLLKLGQVDPLAMI